LKHLFRILVVDQYNLKLRNEIICLIKEVIPLCQKNERILRHNKTILIQCVKNNFMEGIKLILDSRMVDVNVMTEENETAFTYASLFKNFDALQLLYPFIDDINQGIGHKTAIYESFTIFSNNNIPIQLNNNIIEFLVEHGGNIDHGLFGAAQWNNMYWFKYFLNKGANINFLTPDVYSHSILHKIYFAHKIWCVKTINIEMFELAISEGANINHVDLFGKTVLSMAINKVFRYDKKSVYTDIIDIIYGAMYNNHIIIDISDIPEFVLHLFTFQTPIIYRFTNVAYLMLYAYITYCNELPRIQHIQIPKLV